MKAHAVVAIHCTFELQREHQIQVSPPAGDERAARLGRRYLKACIELGHVVLAQEAIRLLYRGDPTQPQLLRQPSLSGPKIALTAAPRLR